MKIYKADGSAPVRLDAIETAAPEGYNEKSEIKKKLSKNIKRMAELQNMLYAQDKRAMLLIFQAMDAAGKDSMIRRVMTGLNPQGTEVYSFKKPSAEELDHDYLWRAHKCCPERGRIGIFNRSYYEEVLVVRVHDLVRKRRIPAELITDELWKERFEQIRGFEDHLWKNGTATFKFFLHVSKQEQKKRFLERIDDSSKNWKFSAADLEERKHWESYEQCYEDAINETGSVNAPWFVIPADNKWYARLMVSEIIVERMEAMHLAYPKLGEAQTARLSECRTLLTQND